MYFIFISRVSSILMSCDKAFITGRRLCYPPVILKGNIINELNEDIEGFQFISLMTA